MRRDVFVFDIETVVDANAARRLLNQPGLTDPGARSALVDYFLEKTGGKNDFPRQPFHQVVAISYAQLISEPGEEGLELVIRRIASGGSPKSSEKELLEGFFGLIEKRAPRLVSYNGRGFDIPVLKYRAMVHGISCSRWFSEGDKWSNYDARYSHEYHVDLMEVLSDYGASARCSMDEVAAALGLPGKLGTTGGDVRVMFESGDIEGIRHYCEMDVITTVLIYLRWQHFRGDLGEGAYARAVGGVHNYLKEESVHRPYLGEFLLAWEENQPA
jgi:hypothetical protein